MTAIKPPFHHHCSCLVGDSLHRCRRIHLLIRVIFIDVRRRNQNRFASSTPQTLHGTNKKHRYVTASPCSQETFGGAPGSTTRSDRTLLVAICYSMGLAKFLLRPGVVDLGVPLCGHGDTTGPPAPCAPRPQTCRGRRKAEARHGKRSLQSGTKHP